MKEMIYLSKFKREVLDTGYCLGLLYYIISLGIHPVAYVKIPKDSKYYLERRREHRSSWRNYLRRRPFMD